MFAYGAAAALIISFAGLAVFWRATRLEDGSSEGSCSGRGRSAGECGRRAGHRPGAVRAAGRGRSLGDPDTAENIAPVFVYVAFWVGMTMVCALVGDLWRVVNPFDTLAALVESLRGGARAPKPYRWGRWPALAALTGFVWLELVYPDRALPCWSSRVQRSRPASDPLGLGWDLFGAAGDAVTSTWCRPPPSPTCRPERSWSAMSPAWSSLTTGPWPLFPPQEATRSQYPLLAAMVLFTVGGLGLLLGA